MSVWQLQKAFNHKLIAALLQRTEGSESIVVDGQEWTVTKTTIEDSMPDDGPFGYVFLTNGGDNIELELMVSGGGILLKETG